MLESISTLILATALLLGSPGPVPIALAATGGIFGIRRSVPFLAGILCGLAVAITLGSAGIVALFNAFPNSKIALGICGGLYIGYVAVKIATAPISSADVNSPTSPPKFREGFLLNILNPKAYAAFIALFSQFLLPLSSNLKSIAATAIIAFGVAILVDVAWLAVGRLLTPVFESPRLARPTRILFGGLMVAAVVLAILAH